MRVLVRMLSHTAVGFVGVTPSKTAPETSSTTRKMGPISPVVDGHGPGAAEVGLGRDCPTGYAWW